MDRSVLHIDVDDFGVAVERVRDPGLRRQALLIAHPAGRSPVLWASTEARSWGVSAGMRLAAAQRLCPSARTLPPDERLYGRAQQALLRVLGRYSPTMETGRWGRLFADLSGTSRLFGPVRDTAQRIGREALSELRLAAHVGLSSNKSTSQVASLVGGDRLVAVFPGSEAWFLAPHPSELLPGAERLERDLLEELNIRRIRQFAETPAGRLGLAFGRLGPLLHMRARGCDPRPVRPPERQPSVAEELALPVDSNQRDELDEWLRGLAGRCGFRLRRDAAAASWMRLHIGYADNLCSQARAALDPPDNADSALFVAARALLGRALERRVRVATLQLECGGLRPQQMQPALFAPAPALVRERALSAAMDAIRERHGAAAINRGCACPASLT